MSISSDLVKSVYIPENMVRDFNFVVSDNATYTIDILNQAGAIGLDLFIRNRSATAIEVSTDGLVNITVDAGDVYIKNHTKFGLLTVTAVAELFDLEISGVLINTLRVQGLIKNSY